MPKNSNQDDDIPLDKATVDTHAMTLEEIMALVGQRRSVLFDNLIESAALGSQAAVSVAGSESSTGTQAAPDEWAAGLEDIDGLRLRSQEKRQSHSEGSAPQSVSGETTEQTEDVSTRWKIPSHRTSDPERSALRGSRPQRKDPKPSVRFNEQRTMGAASGIRVSDHTRTPGASQGGLDDLSLEERLKEAENNKVLNNQTSSFETVDFHLKEGIALHPSQGEDKKIYEEMKKMSPCGGTPFHPEKPAFLASDGMKTYVVSQRSSDPHGKMLQCSWETNESNRAAYEAFTQRLPHDPEYACAYQTCREIENKKRLQPHTLHTCKVFQCVLEEADEAGNVHAQRAFVLRGTQEGSPVRRSLKINEQSHPKVWGWLMEKHSSVPALTASEIRALAPTNIGNENRGR